MGLFSKSSPEQKAARDEAVAAYKDAHAALQANSDKERKAGIREETPEFLRLNSAAHQAAKNPALPWYLRATGYGDANERGR